MSWLSLDEGGFSADRVAPPPGLAPKQFPVQAFVGMISDEIEKMRADASIGRLVTKAAGKTVAAELITWFCASREERGRD